MVLRDSYRCVTDITEQVCWCVTLHFNRWHQRLVCVVEDVYDVKVQQKLHEITLHSIDITKGPTRSPDVIGAKGYLQVFKDLGGVLDPFLELQKQKRWESWHQCSGRKWKDMSDMRGRRATLHTDPARHPSLILVEALNLGQVSGRGALHLETLLRTEDRQRNQNSFIQIRRSFWLIFINVSGEMTRLDTVAGAHLKPLLLCLSKHSRERTPSVTMSTPPPVATTETAAGFSHCTLLVTAWSILGVYILCVNSVPVKAPLQESCLLWWGWRKNKWINKWSWSHLITD